MAQAAAFYAVAQERNIETPTQAFVAGATLPFNLPPSGIGTWLLVSFAGTMTVTSGGTISQPTASPWYPYNLLTVNYQDYLGFTRANCTGWQLHLLEKVKTFQFDPSVTYGAGVATTTQTACFDATVPTAVVSSSPTGPVAFSFVIPVSTTRTSIRGSHLFNITGAQDIVNINCVAPTGGPNGADSPITVPIPGDTSVTVTGTVDVSYYYMDWPSGTVVPMSELALAHQVNSVTQSANIAAGQQYQYLVPTGFIFSRFISEFVNGTTTANAAPNTIDITKFSFLLDANTPIHQENLISYLARSQRLYGTLMPTGVFVTDCSSRPVNSNSYSQVAIQLQLDNTITTGAGTFIRTLADGLTLANQNLQQLGAQS
jgi:hypothetical protein